MYKTLINEYLIFYWFSLCWQLFSIIQISDWFTKYLIIIILTIFFLYFH